GTAAATVAVAIAAACRASVPVTALTARTALAGLGGRGGVGGRGAARSDRRVAGAAGDRRGGRLNPLRADGDLGLAQHRLDVAALLGQHDGHHVAAAAGARGAPGAV